MWVRYLQSPEIPLSWPAEILAHNRDLTARVPRLLILAATCSTNSIESTLHVLKRTERASPFMPFMWIELESGLPEMAAWVLAGEPEAAYLTLTLYKEAVLLTALPDSLLSVTWNKSFLIRSEEKEWKKLLWNTKLQQAFEYNNICAHTNLSDIILSDEILQLKNWCPYASFS